MFIAWLIDRNILLFTIDTPCERALLNDLANSLALIFLPRLPVLRALASRDCMRVPCHAHTTLRTCTVTHIYAAAQQRSIFAAEFQRGAAPRCHALGRTLVRVAMSAASTTAATGRHGGKRSGAGRPRLKESRAT